MSIKYTSGPWRVAESTPAARVHAGDFTFLITNTKGADSEEWDGNARLIAAAPDLLEALELAQIAILALIRRIDPMNADNADIAALDDAERADLAATAAIAKVQAK